MMGVLPDRMDALRDAITIIINVIQLYSQDIIKKHKELSTSARIQ